MPSKGESVRIRERERLVWELAIRSLTLRQIAAAVGEAGLGPIAFQSCGRILRRLEARFLAEMHERAKYLKARQTATLDLVIRESWDAWFRSQSPGHVRSVKGTAVGPGGAPIEKEVTVTVRTRDGDPRFLAEVRAALDAQAKLWGLYARPTDPPAERGAADPEAARRALLAAGGDDDSHDGD